MKPPWRDNLGCADAVHGLIYSIWGLAKVLPRPWLWGGEEQFLSLKEHCGSQRLDWFWLPYSNISPLYQKPDKLGFTLGNIHWICVGSWLERNNHNCDNLEKLWHLQESMGRVGVKCCTWQGNERRKKKGKEKKKAGKLLCIMTCNVIFLISGWIWLIFLGVSEILTEVALLFRTHYKEIKMGRQTDR